MLSHHPPLAYRQAQASPWDSRLSHHCCRLLCCFICTICSFTVLPSIRAFDSSNDFFSADLPPVNSPRSLVPLMMQKNFPYPHLRQASHSHTLPVDKNTKETPDNQLKYCSLKRCEPRKLCKLTCRNDSVVVCYLAVIRVLRISYVGI